MNTYLIEYQQAGDPTVTGSASLVANDDQHAANMFHRCYADEPYRIITKMTRVFVDGKRVDEDVLCYPVNLGGGPVDLSTTTVNDTEVDCPFCESRHQLHTVAECEGRYMMDELANVPPELR